MKGVEKVIVDFLATCSRELGQMKNIRNENFHVKEKPLDELRSVEMGGDRGRS